MNARANLAGVALSALLSGILVFTVTPVADAGIIQAHAKAGRYLPPGWKGDVKIAPPWNKHSTQTAYAYFSTNAWAWSQAQILPNGFKVNVATYAKNWNHWALAGGNHFPPYPLGGDGVSGDGPDDDPPPPPIGQPVTFAYPGVSIIDLEPGLVEINPRGSVLQVSLEELLGVGQFMEANLTLGIGDAMSSVTLRGTLLENGFTVELERLGLFSDYPLSIESYPGLTFAVKFPGLGPLLKTNHEVEDEFFFYGSAVPEPTTLMLLTGGLLLALPRLRRR